MRRSGHFPQQHLHLLPLLLRTLLLLLATTTSAAPSPEYLPHTSTLVATVAVGDHAVVPAANVSLPAALLFRPLGSTATVSANATVVDFVPDRTGDYILAASNRSSPGAYVRVLAVERSQPYLGLRPMLFSDNFTRSATVSGSGLLSTASAFCAWQVTCADASAEVQAGNDQLRLPPGCSATTTTRTVNPVAEPVVFSLLSLPTPASAQGCDLVLSPDRTAPLSPSHAPVILRVTATTIELLHSTETLLSARLPSPPPAVLANLSLTINAAGDAAVLLDRHELGRALNLSALAWRFWLTDPSGVFVTLRPSPSSSSPPTTTTSPSTTFGPLQIQSTLAFDRLPAVQSPVPGLVGLQPAPTLGALAAPLVDNGFLDVTQPPFACDATGATDTTQRLQQALDYARRHYLVAWLPAGQYLVSDTLLGRQTERINAADGSGRHWEDARYAPLVMRGPPVTPEPPAPAGGFPMLPAANRATIILAEASPGFQDPIQPKPVVWLWMENAQQSSQPNANTNQKLESIDLVIRPGNPGALGIRARGAQGLAISDTFIDAGDGLAGLSGGAGSGGSHRNITIRGGRYGVDMTQAQPGPVLSSLTLLDQTCAAIYYGGINTLTVVGLRIRASADVMARAPIVTGCPFTSGGRKECDMGQVTAVQPCDPDSGAALSLVDAAIELEGLRPGWPGAAIHASASVYLSNTFFLGAPTLVRFADGHRLPANDSGHGWTHVHEYAAGVNRSHAATLYPSPVYNSSADAPRDFAPLCTLAAASSPPPPDLVARHQPAFRFPFFRPSTSAPRAVLNARQDFNASGNGIDDDTDALQTALDAAAQSAAVLFVPKGIYRVSRTLDVPAGVRVMGAGLHLTELVPVSGGIVGDVGSDSGPVLRALAGNGTGLARLSIATWRHLRGTWALEWRASQSLYMDVHLHRMCECGAPGGTPLVLSGPSDISVPPCRPGATMDVPLAVINGSAGGAAFYNFYNEDAMLYDALGVPQGVHYRHLLMINSRGLRFYHLNPEHATSDANSEARGCSDIDIFGIKCEGHAPALWVRDSQRVRMFGHGGNAKAPAAGSPLPGPGYWAGPPAIYRISGASSNIRLANLWSYNVAPAKDNWSEVFCEGAPGTRNTTSHPFDRPVLFLCNVDGE